LIARTTTFGVAQGLLAMKRRVYSQGPAPS
jgi:hypothetical protein